MTDQQKPTVYWFHPTRYDRKEDDAERMKVPTIRVTDTVVSYYSEIENYGMVTLRSPSG